jgi:hypothetical protein
MPIRVECPRCHDTAYFADNDAGLAVACLACGQHWRVPAAAQAKPRPAPTPQAIEAAERPLRLGPTPQPPSPPAVRADVPRDLPPQAPAVSAPVRRPTARPAGHVRPVPAKGSWRLYSLLLGLLIAGTLGTLVIAWFMNLSKAATSPLARGEVAPESPPASRVTAAAAAAPNSIAAPAPMVVKPDKKVLSSSVPRPPTASPSRPDAPALLAALPLAPTVRTYTPAAAPVGFVGLDRIDIVGKVLVDSYDTSAAPYAADSARANALLLSNGAIRLEGDGRVAGAVHPGPAAPFKASKRLEISGPTDALAGRLYAPPVTLDPFAHDSANGSIPAAFHQRGNLNLSGNRTLTLAGGVYYLNDVVIDAGSTLRLDGPATLLVSGRLAIGGNIETAENRPANCRIRVTSPQPVIIAQRNALYLDLYAPQSPIEIGGRGDLFGSIVGRTLRVNASRPMHFDESLLPR